MAEHGDARPDQGGSAGLDELLRRLRERAQLYVDLRGYALGPPLRPVQALAQVLGALGIDTDRIPVETDAAAGLYRSLLAGKRMLVVLDNARDAEQVRPLLPGSPGCMSAFPLPSPPQRPVRRRSFDGHGGRERNVF